MTHRVQTHHCKEFLTKICAFTSVTWKYYDLIPYNTEKAVAESDSSTRVLIPSRGEIFLSAATSRLF